MLLGLQVREDPRLFPDTGVKVTDLAHVSVIVRQSLLREVYVSDILGSLLLL